MKLTTGLCVLAAFLALGISRSVATPPQRVAYSVPGGGRLIAGELFRGDPSDSDFIVDGGAQNLICYEQPSGKGTWNIHHNGKPIWNSPAKIGQTGQDDIGACQTPASSGGAYQAYMSGSAPGYQLTVNGAFKTTSLQPGEPTAS
ncbi:uncharacterized protein PFL1_05658 [Pseudozyma flocculosa PF-1]|uniref:Uncharacterized protein n=2 Tax=Pseudozyma flocculosa TaxID=84751 RepID=A0A5C3FET0_9BASI|nr:uncharacterized protein PFL1_05658 [Pseudozyma flocculosa PF-1]EPQ26679.1 hypothetical protein PFL1_05658 [Pseudozyma flocculosa PF-1]SPO42155.1 uncharacterized protein PSFLO_07638 [Pseudozyma flocculosa]